MRGLTNMLILLIKLGRRFISMIEKSKNIGMLSLIARPGCGKFILPKQTSTQTRSLACLSPYNDTYKFLDCKIFKGLPYYATTP
jgi:hypothetical protein